MKVKKRRKEFAPFFRNILDVDEKAQIVSLETTLRYMYRGFIRYIQKG